jgi:phage anti-repressor protein
MSVSRGFFIGWNKMKDLLNIKNQLIGGVSVQAVSARELYIGLGLPVSNWARWSNKNILKNEFFKQGIDFIALFPMKNTTNPNPTVDYGITIDFAKHLTMMARTAKSHDYRNYLINLEKHVVKTFTALNDDDRAMLELTRISPNTLKAITGERNNHKVREGYQALVQAGIFEEVRETREVLRYRPTAEGYDYISGLSETPHFKEDRREQVRFIINQFRLGLGFQVDLFIADKAGEL